MNYARMKMPELQMLWKMVKAGFAGSIFTKQSMQLILEKRNALRGLHNRRFTRRHIGCMVITLGVAMLASFTFWLIILVVLIAFLCLSVGLGFRPKEGRRPVRELLAVLIA